MVPSSIETDKNEIYMPRLSISRLNLQQLEKNQSLYKIIMMMSDSGSHKRRSGYVLLYFSASSYLVIS